MAMNMPRDPAGSTLSYTKEPSERSRPRRHPLLCLVLECHRPLAPPVCFALDDIEEVVLGRGKTRTFRRMADHPRRLEVRLEDERMSSQHARLSRCKGGWLVQDTESKNGSFVNGMKQSEARLAEGDIIELGHSFFRFRQSSVPNSQNC